MTTTVMCRLCDATLPSEPTLQYRNMPRAAQFLPGEADLASETGIDLAVTQCAFCGLVQLLSAPVPYYREVVRATGVSAEMRAFRLAQFNDFADRHYLVGQKVLEFGCGRGDFLALLRAAGMDAEGLEYAPASVAACQSAGLPAHRGFIDDAETHLPGAPFHGFFTFSFLEHLPNPRETLRGIFGNLVTGAVGMVEVPNFDMIVRDGLFSEFIADHLTYFTRDTLHQILALSGFEVTDIQSLWHDYILSATVRKRAAIGLDHLANAQNRLSNDVNRFISGFDRGRVAIWGAGHQALSLINLLSLGQYLRYVVDSAPFKQGRFTPASHVPIVAPAALNADPVDAVMVVAGSYSAEVVATLRRDYNPSMRVAVMGEQGLQIV